MDSNRSSSDMSVSQMALGRKTSFRLNLFQRHDLSPFATRETGRKLDVFDTNFANPAVISPSRSTTAQRREGLVPPFCSPPRSGYSQSRTYCWEANSALRSLKAHPLGCGSC